MKERKRMGKVVTKIDTTELYENFKVEQYKVIADRDNDLLCREDELLRLELIEAERLKLEEREDKEASLDNIADPDFDILYRDDSQNWYEDDEERIMRNISSGCGDLEGL